MEPPDERSGSWTLLTGHGHVLVEIAGNPQARIRDISSVVGLTERTVQAIVADLEAAGYLTRSRTGRRTRYTVNPDSEFRHSAQKGLRVGPLLALLTAMDGADTPGPADPGTNPPRQQQATGRRREISRMTHMDQGKANDSSRLPALAQQCAS